MELAKVRFLREYPRWGTIHAAAEGAEVTREDVERWRRSDAAFAAALESARLDHKDVVEEHIMRRIEGGDGATLRFKARAELPEKYGREGSRPASQEGIWGRIDAKARGEGEGFGGDGRSLSAQVGAGLEVASSPSGEDTSGASLAMTKREGGWELRLSARYEVVESERGGRADLRSAPTWEGPLGPELWGWVCCG